MHSRLLSFQTISGLRTSLCLRALSPCRYACANRRSTRWRPCYAAGVEPKEVTVDQRIALCATVEPCRHRAVLHSFTSFQSPPPYPHLGTTTTGSLRFERRKTGYKEALGSSLVEGRQGSARESRRNRADSFVTTIQCSQWNQRTNVVFSGDAEPPPPGAGRRRLRSHRRLERTPSRPPDRRREQPGREPPQLSFSFPLSEHPSGPAAS
jgi:hypothetical protein